MAKKFAARALSKRAQENIARHARRFNDGLNEVPARRRAWGNFQDLAREVYGEVIKASSDAGLFDLLYIDPDTSGGVSPSSLQHITLLWGRHPLGLVRVSEEGNELIVESGCALHAGQDYLGGVAILLYPFTSELHPSGDDHVLLRVFRNPTDISRRRLEKYVRVFFSYAQVTSVFGRPKLRDRLTVIWVRTCATFLKLGWSNRLKIVSSTVPKIIGVVKAVGAAIV